MYTVLVILTWLDLFQTDLIFNKCSYLKGRSKNIIFYKMTLGYLFTFRIGESLKYRCTIIGVIRVLICRRVENNCQDKLLDICGT